MTLDKGELVKHPNRPDWGVGQINSIEDNDIVHVTFSRVGIKSLHLGKVSFSLIKIEKTRNALITDHRDFIKYLGKPYNGIRFPQKQRSRRTTHCYNCKSQLDNAVDVECIACGWIVCWCGACGCGFHS